MIEDSGDNAVDGMEMIDPLERSSLEGFGVCVLVGEFEVDEGFWLCWVQLSVTNIMEKLGCNQGWRKERDVTFS